MSVIGVISLEGIVSIPKLDPKLTVWDKGGDGKSLDWEASGTDLFIYKERLK